MTQALFGRDKRLLAAADFSAVFNDARYKISTGKMLILATPVNQSFSRLGLVVAKKNIRQAVNRNRFKRLVREVFRQQQCFLSGLDVVVLARRGFDQLSAEQQINLVKQSFEQLKKNSSKTSE